MRILVVEDEPVNLEEIERIIRADDPDAEIVGILNPLEAVENVRQQAFDVALLDIQMPGVTGLDLADQISVIQPALPFIFVTAYNIYATEAFELNAVDYVLKPIRPERLLKAVNKIKSSQRRSKTPENMARLHEIRTFGGLRVIADFGEVRWDRTKTGELFAYLLMKKGVRIHKDQICEDLWPNLDTLRALANLQVTVCRLRKIFSAFERIQVCINFSSHFYTLTLNDVLYDLEQFDHLSAASDEQSLHCAAELYLGEYLEPEGWLWAENERAACRQKYLHTVWTLANLYRKKGDLHQAGQMLRSFIIKIEPDDDVSRLFLALSAELDGRPGLTRALNLLRSRYDQSLGMQVPQPVQHEFQRLRDQIV